MKNIFDLNDIKTTIERINRLTPTTKPLWGEMSVDKMLAHCNVSYEMIFENSLPKPKGIKRILLRLIVKPIVVSEKPYKKSLRTAPQFLIASAKNFENEKERLIKYIKKVQNLGGEYFDNLESHSFGKLTKTQWNNMLYKHLNHHLTQFGV